ncbi:MAG: retron system putative HNH endonuclease [Butyricimonas faecihominis]
MIKINKDINDIPQSLVPAVVENFPNGRIPKPCRTTHTRRKELIDQGEYIDNKNYNSRYKQSDIKEKLKVIYHGKCAFCEQKVEQLHVEHYRPKGIYYWLAYSWDNLILACPTCNEHKGVNFELNGTRCSFDNNEENLRNINNLSSGYNISEQPKMVNPEISDPTGHITFSKDGKIDSLDSNFKYTINTCRLDRKYLNDERRKLLDTFKNEIRAELVGSINEQEQRQVIEVLVRRFIRVSNDLSNEYIAFRKYSILNNWLTDIVQDLN